MTSWPAAGSPNAEGGVHVPIRGSTGYAVPFECRYAVRQSLDTSRSKAGRLRTTISNALGAAS